MAAPKFVPVPPVGSFRDAEGLPPAAEWRADRPADLRAGQPTARGMGRPGPDQGYALKLAHGFHGKLRLQAGENEHDVVAGCLPIALKRASLYGRAPVIHDLTLAFSLFGFLAEPAGLAPELAQFRRSMFEAAGHHYELQRTLADLVPESTLRLTPGEVTAAVSGGRWKSLLASA